MFTALRQKISKLLSLGSSPAGNVSDTLEILPEKTAEEWKALFPSRVQPASPWPYPKWTKNTQNSIQAGFEKFHKENPDVYKKLVDLAFLAKANGHQHLGIKTLFERLRWYYTVETKGNEPFKLNNNWTAYYARMIMQREPSLTGFFRTRELY